MNAKLGILFIGVALLVFCAFVGTISAADIYVPADYTKIQWAVDNATAGDSIIVNSGTYYENVNVTKQLILRGVDTGTGKPVVDASDSGSAITLSADGITLDGFTATNSTSWWEEDAGIKVISHNNTITGNSASNNGYAGIFLYNASNNTITGNTASNNFDGIFLYHASNNMITGNNASNSHSGIFLYHASNNTITGNNASNNGYAGIGLSSYSNNNIITGNNASNNSNYGIYLYYYSNNNAITGNTASNNNYGIELYYSNGNRIYLNNFINNTNSVYCYNPTNIWNSTEKITYTYNSSQYTNYLGSYWDDYEGADADGDGIGDSSYGIPDDDNDNYPLMMHLENYFVATENNFDTGPSENPYPSIFGTHNGTIKANQTITVSKLYTYPCEGTGGHTEYTKIYNDSWSIETLPWEGYKGDWRNLSFSESFKLYANVEYNYTIRTGSYSQIIHKKEFNATGGKITCSEFIDANGRSYNNWIPAIKLK
jgi:parallel beta-helix repeat protein